MNRGHSGEERRRFKRVGVSFTVTLVVKSPLSVRNRFAGEELVAVLLDISEGGIAVLINYDIPEGSVVSVRCIAYNDKARDPQQRSKMLQAEGEVRYCILTKERSYRLGIRFIDLLPEDKEFISELVKAA